MKKDRPEIFVTLKQRRFLLWTATRATAVARHGFDCCFSLSSSRSLSLFPPSFFFRSSASRRDTRKQLLLHRWPTRHTARRLARCGANANSNSLFFIARAARIQRGPGASTSSMVHRPASAPTRCDAAASPSARPWPRASYFSYAESARLPKNHNASIDVHARYKSRVRVYVENKGVGVVDFSFLEHSRWRSKVKSTLSLFARKTEQARTNTNKRCSHSLKQVVRSRSLIWFRSDFRLEQNGKGK